MCLARADRHRYARIGLRERIADRRSRTIDGGSEVLLALACDGHDGARVARNGVAALAAGERDKPERDRLQGLAESPPENLHRIRAAERDAHPGVTSLPAADRDGERHGALGGRRPLAVDVDPRVRAARAPDGELPVLLAVQVDEDRAGHERGVERVRPFETDLLGHRHEELERPVRKRLVLDERHHRRDRDAVVRAERRPVRGQPVAVADELDASLRRVVRARGVAFANDVQVPLKRYGRSRLPPGSRGDAYDEVPPGILNELEAVLLGPRADVLDRRLLMPRRARDPRQRLEVPPERAGLESRQNGRLVGHVVGRNG